jgi:hypothetical protein
VALLATEQKPSGEGGFLRMAKVVRAYVMLMADNVASNAMAFACRAISYCTFSFNPLASCALRA